MDILENYDVRLIRLTEDKIEMVRNWRNDPKISQYMLYQDFITPEMQRKWFERINNDRNYYYIIEFKGKEVGLIDVKDIDYEKKVGEGGIFIYEEDFLDTDLAYRCHILLFDFVFREIGLNGILSEIQPTNQRAIRFATFLGSKITKETPECFFFLLTKNNYLSNKNRQRFIKRWNYYKTK